MWESEEGVAQVVEFTASITILVIVFTAFFTALGFQAAHYVDATPRSTGKAISVTDYLMAEPGRVVNPNTTAWETLPLAVLDNLTSDELASFGLSTGEYGVLSLSKLMRLRGINATEHQHFYDIVRYRLGLASVVPGYNPPLVRYSYDLNISVEYLDGTPVVRWGYPMDERNFITSSHTVIYRVVLIEADDGSRVPARLTLDLVSLG